MRLHNIKESLEHLAAVQTLCHQVFGENSHPRVTKVAVTASNSAIVNCTIDNKGAQDSISSALEILKKTYGQNSIQCATTLLNFVLIKFYNDHDKSATETQLTFVKRIIEDIDPSGLLESLQQKIQDISQLISHDAQSCKDLNICNAENIFNSAFFIYLITLLAGLILHL